jgi:hypothetical protein
MIYSYHTEIPNKERVGALGFYAHGELEDYLEYDIVLVPCSINSDQSGYDVHVSEGIYPTIVKHHTEEIPCTMYCWKRGGTGRKTGILVFDTDLESVAYAQELYDCKAESV